MRTALTLLLLVLTLSSSKADVTLGVTSSGARFSPATWAGDAGRGGTVRRTTWNNGAWCEWRWTTSAAAPHATLQITNPTSGSAVSYFLDGVLTDNVSVPSSGGIPISGLTPGAHLLTVYTRNSPQSSRWNGANAFTVTGLTVDDDAAAGSFQTHPFWVLIVGDSITEGIQADNGGDSSLRDYSFLVGQGLSATGVDTAVSACGYSGWLRPGDAGGDVPAYYAVTNGVYDPAASRWSRLNAATSLLDSSGHLSAYGGLHQEPTEFLLNYGVNECLSGSSRAGMAVSIQGTLAALRRAAPNAKIILLIPPGLADTHIYPNGPAYIATLRSAFHSYQTAHKTDASTLLVDLGPDVAHALGSPAYGGGVHPNAAGHAYLAPKILMELVAASFRG